MITLIIEFNPTYNVRRIPIAPSIGGTRINKAGIIGITLSIPYDGFVGGVTNGSENKFDRFSIPRSLPSIKYIAAKPNIMFEKKAPKSRTFVICHITKCGTDNL